MRNREISAKWDKLTRDFCGYNFGCEMISWLVSLSTRFDVMWFIDRVCARNFLISIVNMWTSKKARGGFVCFFVVVVVSSFLYVVVTNSYFDGNFIDFIFKLQCAHACVSVDANNRKLYFESIFFFVRIQIYCIYVFYLIVVSSVCI